MAARRRKRKKKMWIQKAVKSSRKGALHRALGLSPDKTIPLQKLKKAGKRQGRVGKMARLALTLRSFHSK